MGSIGSDFLKTLGQSTVPLRYQEKYANRLKFISHLAAIYHNNKQISFTPSFEIKDKTVLQKAQGDI